VNNNTKIEENKEKVNDEINDEKVNDEINDEKTKITNAIKSIDLK
jgi:hypothetical protein